MPSAFLVGDLHFKDAYAEDGRQLADALVAKIKKVNPTFVVLLGDILDKMCRAEEASFNLAYYLLCELADYTVYILMGNHDYRDCTQFLTEKHFFNPYKKWENVVVVDKVIASRIDGKRFLFCPYVPPGRFVEALQTTVKDFTKYDAIFAHQEFYGCKMGAITSEIGDAWKSTWPTVFSGHIHEEQVLDNIYYTGCAMQHGYTEGKDKKKVWLVTFKGNDFTISKYDLGIKGKRLIYLDIERLDNWEPERLLAKYHIKLSLRCTTEEYKVFRRSKQYTALRKQGIKLTHCRRVYDQPTQDKPRIRTRERFEDILSELAANNETTKELWQQVVRELGVQ